MLFYLAEEVKSERVFSIGYGFCRSNFVCFESFEKKSSISFFRICGGRQTLMQLFPKNLAVSTSRFTLIPVG